MSPESILTHLKREAIHACVSGIENCPIPVIVEFANGDEAKIQKVYHVGGRASCIKILIDELPENPADLDEIHNLRAEVEQLKEENEEYEGEIEDLKTSAEKQENELNSAENALEDFEHKTGFKTSARSLDARIEELADLVLELQEKANDILEENIQLQSQLEEINSAAEDKKFN